MQPTTRASASPGTVRAGAAPERPPAPDSFDDGYRRPPAAAAGAAILTAVSGPVVPPSKLVSSSRVLILLNASAWSSNFTSTTARLAYQASILRPPPLRKLVRCSSTLRRA